MVEAVVAGAAVVVVAWGASAGFCCPNKGVEAGVEAEAPNMKLLELTAGAAFGSSGLEAPNKMELPEDAGGAGALTVGLKENAGVAADVVAVVAAVPPRLKIDPVEGVEKVGLKIGGAGAETLNMAWPAVDFGPSGDICIASPPVDLVGLGT